MFRHMLKSKIHRATVTGADLNYEGSLTLDKDFMELADLRPFEQVKIYNISNGERFDTYVIEGRRGSKEVCLNGAAARKGSVGDLIIVASYALYAPGELDKNHSVILIMGEGNVIKEIRREPWGVGR